MRQDSGRLRLGHHRRPGYVGSVDRDLLSSLVFDWRFPHKVIEEFQDLPTPDEDGKIHV